MNNGEVFRGDDVVPTRANIPELRKDRRAMLYSSALGGVIAPGLVLAEYDSLGLKAPIPFLAVCAAGILISAVSSVSSAIEAVDITRTLRRINNKQT